MNSNNIEMPETIWSSTCKSVNISENISKKWLVLLKTQYSQVHRNYYKWNVFEIKINFMKNISNHIIFAVFFQYYEYNVKEDCSESNCNAFKEFYSESGINDENLLRSTLFLLGDFNVVTSDLVGISDDLNYFRDMDLIILGQSQDEYDIYIQLLRKDYPNMDDTSYKSYRLKILKASLSIPFVYSTLFFRFIFEENAKRNIKYEVSTLEQNK